MSWVMGHTIEYKKNMALRGLKITWVCIAILFISCSIILSIKFKNIHFCYFQNTFPFVSTFRQTNDIRKKPSKKVRGTPLSQLEGIDILILIKLIIIMSKIDYYILQYENKLNNALYFLRRQL